MLRLEKLVYDDYNLRLYYRFFFSRFESQRISIYAHTHPNTRLRAYLFILGTRDRSTLHARSKAIQSEKHAYRL